jgi:hypothetical protein
MPARELSIAAQLSEDPSPTHTWLLADGRQLELESGQPLVHRMCTVCKRNFVFDIAAKEWYAAYPRMFDFERLVSVTHRWLSEACPGRYLASDEDAWKR